MDATQALRFLRKRCFGSRYCNSDDGLGSFHGINATYKAVFQDWSTDEYVYGKPEAQIVASNPHFKLDKMRELEWFRKEYRRVGATNDGKNDHDSLKQFSSTLLTTELEQPMDTLQNLVRDYLNLSVKSPLTLTEQSFSNHIEQVILAILLQMLSEGEDQIADVDAFFIELVLRPNDPSRMFAFTLIYNMHLAVGENPLLRIELFNILLDMVERLIHTPLSKTVLPFIKGCIVEMTMSGSPSDIWIPERLVALPVSLLIVLLNDETGDMAPIMEILVLGIYLRQMMQSAEPLDQYGTRKSRERLTQCDLSSELCPVDILTGMPDFEFDLDVVRESTESISDILLCHFFTTSSAIVQHLIFMVLFDVAKANLRQDHAALEEVFTSTVELGLSSAVATYPTILLPSHLAPFLARLDGAHPEMMPILGEIAQVARVAEFFVQSPTLAHIIQKRRWSSGENLSSTVTQFDALQKVSQLLEASLPQDRFKAQRWLAELLSWPHNDSAINLVELSIDNGTLSDPWHALRIQARSKFWEGIRSTSMVVRVGMVQVLALRAQRELSPSKVSVACNGETNRGLKLKEKLEKLLLILRDVNAVMKVWVDNGDASEQAWCAIVELVIKLCCRQLNYVHQRRQLKKSPREEYLPRSFCYGELALDRDLVNEISSSCYLTALSVLSSSSSIDPSLCAALAIVVKSVYNDVHLFTRVGGLTRFRSFLEAPHHPFVSLCIAELLVAMVREGSRDLYYSTLKEMQTQAQDLKDERALDNPYIHCRHILARMYQLQNIPLD
ncbi:hypothetical protein AeMF1_021156 [Aphanomyces euteiches]|nr:hypothetical protein AeMF1_021156 [Aphanomyces euteiches]